MPTMTEPPAPPTKLAELCLPCRRLISIGWLYLSSLHCCSHTSATPPATELLSSAYTPRASAIRAPYSRPSSAPSIAKQPDNDLPSHTARLNSSRSSPLLRLQASAPHLHSRSQAEASQSLVAAHRPSSSPLHRAFTTKPSSSKLSLFPTLFFSLASSAPQAFKLISKTSVKWHPSPVEAHLHQFHVEASIPKQSSLPPPRPRFHN